MTDPSDPNDADERRRDFLKKCGRFAAVTPPAVTLLLSTAMTSGALAKSGGGGGGRGQGHGHGHGRGGRFGHHHRHGSGRFG